MLLEDMRDGFVLGQPEGVVERANKQGLDRLALGVLLHAEQHHVSLRLLENHLRDLEQRIRPARHLDLPRQGFHAFVFRAQARLDFRQRQWRAPFTRSAPAKVGSRAARRLAAPGLRPGRAAPFAARAVAVPSRAGRAIAAGGAGAASVAVPAAVESFGLALVMGVFRGRRLLCPGGQKEFVQIQFAIRQYAHCFTSGAFCGAPCRCR